MINQRKDLINQHVKTHTERSVDDRAAVAVLETFLRSDGYINTNFSTNDKWPNHDGTLEFVKNPTISKQPKQSFYVQIKGTHLYNEKDGIVTYSLQDLAFPAFICSEVSLDPGILFVVFNSRKRESERVFWKYMSAEFLNTIDFSKGSITIKFSEHDEILNTDESIFAFCKKLDKISNHHLFIKQLSCKDYTKADVERIIQFRDKNICESIDRIEIFNENRDEISARVLTYLEDLCSATLLLNAIHDGYENPSIRFAWEHASLNITTKYLGSFLKGLHYIGKRIPAEGQSERLMLKYYDYLWQIRKLLKEKYRIKILENLEKFPIQTDDNIDKEYYEQVAKVIESVSLSPSSLRSSKYYIQKKVPFFIGQERYYEITLQLSGVYASKYNRITAYTKDDISTSYTVQIGYAEVPMKLWDMETKIKVITTWSVAIAPICLNNLSKILRMPTRLSSQYKEYHSLMSFLTKTGVNLLELIDLQEIKFEEIIESIYTNVDTSIFKPVLMQLRKRYSKDSKEYGSNVIRYLLGDLREETLEGVMPKPYTKNWLCEDLYIASSCWPFEKNPFVSNLAGSKTSRDTQINRIFNVAGADELKLSRPYLSIRNEIKRTGEIYFEVPDEYNLDAIQEYNNHLDKWEKENGFQIKLSNQFLFIDSYEKETEFILKNLLKFSKQTNKGQAEYNKNFIKHNPMDTADTLKKQAIQNVFVNSRLLLIYGAAGTGKTTLINYVSNLMKEHRKLFLTKTHTALQNLKRRIDNPGPNSDFICIDSFTKKVNLPDYDIIFIDECSTIDNRTMKKFLSIIRPNTFLVMAGDIHQIESIDFGNWFFYAKEIITSPGSNVELLSTWRTNDPNLINLWDEVRNREALISEKLVIDGPFSENIGPAIFDRKFNDEVILCLNYDGKFGLNNMNNYFQAANLSSKAVTWEEWSYKIGDPILFNDTKRFPLLYNNLKGKIVDIDKSSHSISFTVDVEIPLTEADCQRDEIEYIDSYENGTRIRFTIDAYENQQIEEHNELRQRSVIPFQLAYAVSIHKAQGLEYDSVKVVIPSTNAEKITHGIFYTAITRAKLNLKIYWSSETMQEVVDGFISDNPIHNSLNIIKDKLKSSV